jgi:hypothetical protein
MKDVPDPLSGRAIGLTEITASRHLMFLLKHYPASKGLTPDRPFCIYHMGV